MKKYLLPRLGKFYKANMHTHTNISDGKLTPEEVKAKYKEKGYSIVAFTDHEIMMPHYDLRDDEFLPITAYEIQIRDLDRAVRTHKVYHMNVYSPDPERYLSKTYCKKDAWWGNIVNHFTDEMAAAGLAERHYTKNFAQWIINTANSEGMLVSYNHPVWSLQNHDDYSGLKGFWGVEWYNNECVKLGYFDTTAPITDLLSEGERVFPLATDDAHSSRSIGGGWLKVKAKSLDYDTVFKALKKGDFYSSNGPEIKSLYIEDGVVHISTSAVKQITLVTDRREVVSIDNFEDGKPIFSADLSLSGLLKSHAVTGDYRKAFFRIEITDKYGKKALTRAYFLDEFDGCLTIKEGEK